MHRPIRKTVVFPGENSPCEITNFPSDSIEVSFSYMYFKAKAVLPLPLLMLYLCLRGKI